MKRVVLYISSHGFGHAVRMAEVVRELMTTEPEWSVVIRTTAPAHLFDPLRCDSVRVDPVEIDSGVVETDGTLQIDVAATVERLNEFVCQREEIINAEVAFVDQVRPSIIVADIPYLAGEIGERSKVPVVGISNFTWDYIYEPFLNMDTRGSHILQVIQSGYKKMAALLRLPFYHEANVFSQVVDVGLVTSRSNRQQEEILEELDMAGAECRPKIYLGLRGSVSWDALEKAARESPEFLFLYFGQERPGLPENVRHVLMSDRLTFSDILAISDVVVSKLGYGMVAACIANRVSLLYPPRSGFREDLGLQTGVQRYLRARLLPLDSFRHGDWRADLLALRLQAAPTASLPLDGAQQCARMITSAARPA